MTVSTEIVTHCYFPGVSMAEEPIPFQFLDRDHIIAFIDRDVPLISGTDYVLIGDGSAKTGKIRTLRAFLPDEKMTVTRATPRLQQAVTDPFKPLPAEQLGRELDRRAMVEQELDRDILRTFRYPDGEEATELPARQQRALKSLGFDANGDPIAAALPDGTVLSELQAVVAIDGQTAFVFEGLNGDLVELKVNGVAFPNDPEIFTVAGDTISFTAGRAAGDIIQPKVAGGWSTALATRNATQASPGLMPRTDKIKSDREVDLKALGCIFDGSFDNKNVIANAFGDLMDSDVDGRRGGIVHFGPYGALYTSESFTVPRNVQMKGSWWPSKGRGVDNYLDTCPSILMMPTDKTVYVDGGVVRNMLFWNPNIIQSPRSADVYNAQLAKFAGTAVTLIGDDSLVYQNMFIGHNLAVYGANIFNPEIFENCIDCNNGIEVTQVFDSRSRGISNNIGKAWYVQNAVMDPDPGWGATLRPGTFLYVHDGAEGITCEHNKDYGFRIGLHMKNVYEIKAKFLCDGPALYVPELCIGNIGILLEGTLNGCELYGCGIHGHDYGIVVRTADYVQMGNITIGVSLNAQLYLASASQGYIGNIYMGGFVGDPIYAEAGVGEWRGTIDSRSTANSGNFVYLENPDDGNALRGLMRRQRGVSYADPYPQGMGWYPVADLPPPKDGMEAIVTNSSTTERLAPVVGGGSFIVRVTALAGVWKVT
jgi:hypothetical protein